eukprot:1842497-Rhodomonas_salina.1
MGEREGRETGGADREDACFGGSLGRALPPPRTPLTPTTLPSHTPLTHPLTPAAPSARHPLG